MATDPNAVDLKMDPANLYREDLFTDRSVGMIRVLTPVRSDGSPDPSRSVLYVGEAQLLTPVGARPLAFEIDASSLGEAAEKFAAAARVGVERAVKELQELRRDAASSNIIIPERGVPPDLGGLRGPRGGGRIQFP